MDEFFRLHARTPRERWGTCCPFDPECDHSFLDELALQRWMTTPLSDDEARVLAEEET